MSENDLKSEKFFNLCRIASLSVWKKFYRDPTVLDDYLTDCYIYILTNKERLNGFKIEEEKDLFYKLFKMCVVVMNFYQKERKDKQTFTDMGEKFFYSKVSDFSIWSKLNYSLLINEMKTFLKNYSETEQKCIVLLIQGNKPNPISKRFKISVRHLSQLLRSFRRDFQTHLIKNGYLNAEIYSNFDEDSYARKMQKLRLAKKRGETIDYGEYSNDFLIYKLLRKENNLEIFSQSLGITLKELNDIITHKTKKKLLLYQIQKLRKFFPNFSLKDLVGEAC